MYAVTVHGYMEENDVKSTCGGTMLEFKIEKRRFFFIWHVVKLYIQSLTRRQKISFGIWRVVFFPNQNLERCIFFNSKCDTLWNFQYKFMLLKKTQKKPKMSFSRSKRNQSVTFWMQTLFKILHVKKVSFQNLTRCFFPIWRVVKLLNQILSCCIF